MTNDERNPKPECERAFCCAMARSSFGFRYSFGFRHSSFGFENCGSWKALATLMPCIGTMNLEQVGRCHRQGAADVSSAELLDSSAGKMPAAPWFMESPTGFSQPTPTPLRSSRQ